MASFHHAVNGSWALGPLLWNLSLRAAPNERLLYETFTVSEPEPESLDHLDQSDLAFPIPVGVPPALPCVIGQVQEFLAPCTLAEPLRRVARARQDYPTDWGISEPESVSLCESLGV